MASDGPTLDTPLWAFSLAVYAADGVAAECLDVQERFGVDVNLLLFAAYAGAVDGVQLDTQDIAAAAGVTSAWHNNIVRALRTARRALKPATLDNASPSRAAAAELRMHVKRAELDSEKIEQTMLWSWWRRSASRSRGNNEVALGVNLDALLAHYGAPTGPEMLAKLKAATLIFARSKS
jgi:uncharacterized protein (TIGR02444 family)